MEHLKALIGDRSAIEIGAGHGVLAQTLHIPATDSRQQEIPHYRTWITSMGQPPVRYGPNVIGCDAIQAAHEYQPDIVIGCWVTHRYDPARHWAGGNEMGIDEVELLRWCRRYILIGNEEVHRNKAIWALPHMIEYPPWLVSRAMNGSREFIAVWDGTRPEEHWSMTDIDTIRSKVVTAVEAGFSPHTALFSTATVSSLLSEIDRLTGEVERFQRERQRGCQET